MENILCRGKKRKLLLSLYFSVFEFHAIDAEVPSNKTCVSRKFEW